MYLSLRTKPTVEEGITHRERLPDGREVVEYQPGDGSRYLLIISPLDGFSRCTCERMGIGHGDGVIVTHASDPGDSRSLITHRGATIAYNWLQPKFRTTLASAITLSELVAFLIGGKALSCEEAQRRFDEVE